MARVSCLRDADGSYTHDNDGPVQCRFVVLNLIRRRRKPGKLCARIKPCRIKCTDLQTSTTTEYATRKQLTDSNSARRSNCIWKFFRRRFRALLTHGSHSRHKRSVAYFSRTQYCFISTVRRSISTVDPRLNIFVNPTRITFLYAYTNISWLNYNESSNGNNTNKKNE